MLTCRHCKINLNKPLTISIPLLLFTLEINKTIPKPCLGPEPVSWVQTELKCRGIWRGGRREILWVRHFCVYIRRQVTRGIFGTGNYPRGSATTNPEFGEGTENVIGKWIIFALAPGPTSDVLGFILKGKEESSNPRNTSRHKLGWLKAIVFRARDFFGIKWRPREITKPENWN